MKIDKLCLLHTTAYHCCGESLQKFYICSCTLFCWYCHKN